MARKDLPRTHHALFLAGLCAVLSAPLAAQTTVILTDDRSEYSLGQHLEVLEDKSKSLTLDEVASPGLNAQFRPGRQDTLNFGFANSAYWVRFRVENRSRTTAWQLALQSSSMNFVTLFVPTPDGRGYLAKETGNVLPFATRDVPHHLFQFKLPPSLLTTARTAEAPFLYMRFESEAAMILPLKVWARQELEQHNQLELLGLGLFYGVLLALIGYNLLLFLSLRDASYFYHVLHLALSTLCLLAYDGLGQRFLWPYDWVWDPRMVIFFLSAATGAALQFTRALLRTSVQAPRVHKVLGLLAWTSVAFAVLSLVVPYRSLAAPGILFQLVAYGLILQVSWSVWRRGYRQARFFLAAWLVFAIGTPILLTLTRVVPILPAQWMNIGLRLGVDGFVLLFSLALADRIHIIRTEKEQAQAKLVREQQDALVVKDALNVALQSSKSELTARNAELERYAYTVSHDLKSPVITIKGFLGLLEKDLAEGRGHRTADHIRRVYGAADKMSRLLDELLEMSRVGRVIGPAEAIDLSELVEEAITLVAGPIEEQGIVVDIAPQMPVVSGDRMRLLEVFQNLIENAVKFTRDQAAPRIEIRAWQDSPGENSPGEDSSEDGGQGKGRVTCCVQDNGIGIAPAYHETVFGLFDQLDPSGGGTGIGLALVKRIVEVHGGKIWVESEGAGQGCALVFTLPPHVS